MILVTLWPNEMCRLEAVSVFLLFFLTPSDLFQVDVFFRVRGFFCRTVTVDRLLLVL